MIFLVSLDGVDRLFELSCLPEDIGYENGAEGARSLGKGSAYGVDPPVRIQTKLMQ